MRQQGLWKIGTDDIMAIFDYALDYILATINDETLALQDLSKDLQGPIAQAQEKAGAQHAKDQVDTSGLIFATSLINRAKDFREMRDDEINTLKDMVQESICQGLNIDIDPARLGEIVPNLEVQVNQLIEDINSGQNLFHGQLTTKEAFTALAEKIRAQLNAKLAAIDNLDGLSEQTKIRVKNYLLTNQVDPNTLTTLFNSANQVDLAKIENLVKLLKTSAPSANQAQAFASLGDELVKTLSSNIQLEGAKPSRERSPGDFGLVTFGK